MENIRSITARLTKLPFSNEKSIPIYSRVRRERDINAEGAHSLTPPPERLLLLSPSSPGGLLFSDSVCLRDRIDHRGRRRRRNTSKNCHIALMYGPPPPVLSPGRHIHFSGNREVALRPTTAVRGPIYHLHSIQAP